MIRTLLITGMAACALVSAAYAGHSDQRAGANQAAPDQGATLSTNAFPSSGGAGVGSDPDVDVLAMRPSNKGTLAVH